MGSRSTQIIGLNPVATELVAGREMVTYHETGERIWPDGQREAFSRDVTGSDVYRENSGRWYYGMFPDEEYPLLRYRLPDGNWLYEAVQADPWSAGPCIFLALRDGAPDGPWLPETLWSDQEIADA
jgi:hypothetical protein